MQRFASEEERAISCEVGGVTEVTLFLWRRASSQDIMSSVLSRAPLSLLVIQRFHKAGVCIVVTGKMIACLLGAWSKRSMIVQRCGMNDVGVRVVGGA